MRLSILAVDVTYSPALLTIAGAGETQVLVSDSITPDLRAKLIQIHAYVSGTLNAGANQDINIRRGSGLGGFTLPNQRGLCSGVNATQQTQAGTWFDQPFSTTTFQYTLTAINWAANVQDAAIIVYQLG